jgi:hypothetical protein
VKDMKLAVCLCGLARGSTINAGGAYGEKFEYLRRFISKYDHDVFIHSWDVDIASELDEIFQPRLSKYEPQRSFQSEMGRYSDCNFGETLSTISQGDLFKTHSFLYSRYESIRLKREYELTQNMNYDMVLISRFDVGHHNGGANKTSHLPIEPPTKPTNKIHQAYWNQTNAGASDHWFIVNSGMADYIGDLYKDLELYLKPNSEYDMCCREGWVKSNSHDEFSGEMFKDNSSVNLVRHTDSGTMLVNNHCLYKWHMHRINKWNTTDCVFHNEHMWR